MKLRETQHSHVDVFQLAGEIDLHYAPALRALFRVKLKQRCSALIVDLSEVSFIDSTGISVLLEYLRDAAEFNGRFCFAAPTDHVRNVFEIVQLHKAVPIFDTVADAATAMCDGAKVEPAEPLFWRAGTDCAPDAQPSAFRQVAP